MKIHRLYLLGIIFSATFFLSLSCKSRKELGSTTSESSSNLSIYKQPIPQHKGPLYLFSWGDKELHRKMVFGDNGESPMDTIFNIVRNPWRAARAKNPEATAGAAGPGLYFSRSWADSISFGKHVLVAKVSPVSGDSFPFPSVPNIITLKTRIEDAVLENRGDEPFAANDSKSYIHALNGYSTVWTILVHKPWKEDNIKIEFVWLDNLDVVTVTTLANEFVQTVKSLTSREKGSIVNASFSNYDPLSFMNTDKNSLDFIKLVFSSLSDEMVILLERGEPSVELNATSSLIALIRFFNDVKDGSKISRVQQLLLARSLDNKIYFSYMDFIPILNSLEIDFEKDDMKQMEIFLEIIKNISATTPAHNSSDNGVSRLLGPMMMSANSPKLRTLIEKYFDTPFDILEWTKGNLSNEQKTQIESSLKNPELRSIATYKGKCVLCGSSPYSGLKSTSELHKEWPAAFSRLFKAIDEPIPR